MVAMKYLEKSQAAPWTVEYEETMSLSLREGIRPLIYWY